MKITQGLRVGLALVALFVTSAVAKGQTTTLYSAQTLPATPETGVVHYLQLVNLAEGAGTYSVNQVVLGINFSGVDPQGLIVNFYDGSTISTSTTSTNALAAATAIGGFDSTFTPPSAANYTYTFTLSTPQSLALTNGSLGVEVELTDTLFSVYSTEENGRFTAAAPDAGSAAGYVWNDANLDNVFTGAEQTRFGQANANIRFAVIGSAPTAVPEPVTAGAGLIGTALLLGRRRRAA